MTEVHRPSGATTAPPDCQVERIPGGPVLVRGAEVITDDDGVEHRTQRPVVAVCACGFTQRAPWCDGTHKVARTS